MVSLKDIQAANASLKDSKPSLTALFVGATNGIGASTVKKLALHIKAPIIYLAGRSKSSAAPLLTELKSINPQGTFTFIEAEVSLLKDVDKVCDEIKSKEQKLDLLWLSAGLLNSTGRQDTSEGLDLMFALSYYSRMRFISSLLPLLSKSSSPRVVTILAAGLENKMITDDLELSTNYSMTQAMDQEASMMSLSLDELAKANPKVSFIHKYPGIVNTGLVDKMFAAWTGVWSVLGSVVRWCVLPVMGLFLVSVDEAGERGLYVATNVKFAAGGFYRLDWNDENAKHVAVYESYKAEGMGKTVWEHTVGVFERVLSRN